MCEVFFKMVSGICFKQVNCSPLPIAEKPRGELPVGFELSYLDVFSELGHSLLFCSFSVNAKDRIYQVMDATVHTQHL